MRGWGRPWVGVMLAAAVGCGGEGTTGDPSSSGAGGGHGGALPTSACPPGERELDDGSCLEPGVQASGCPAGSRMVEGRCQAAGIPPGACGPGFVHDGEATCEVVLPDEDCGPGTRAVPGDTSCRGFVDCGTGDYPDVAPGRAPIHVDASYGPGNGDGSASQPFRTIVEGVAAAADGDVVAVAAGTYEEAVVVEGKSVTIWGRCPSMVTVQANAAPGLRIGPGADGSIVRDIAVTGDGPGIVVEDAEAVLLDALWLHDLAGPGVTVAFDGAAAAATLRDVLIEGATERGVYAEGSQVMIDRSVIRDTALPAGGLTARAVNIRDDVETGEPGAGVIQTSLLAGGHEVGLMVHASTVLVDDTLLRGVAPTPDGRFGRCVNVQVGGDSTAPASLSLERSLVSSCFDGGVVSSGAELVVEATVVRDIAASEDELHRGYGLVAQIPYDVDSPASLVVVDSVVERTHEAGVFVAGSHAEATGLLVKDTRHVTPSDPTLPALFGGRAFEVQRDPVAAADAGAVLVGCRFVGNEEGGLVVNGGTVVAEGVAIEDTAPLGAYFGRGVIVQADVDAVAGDVRLVSSVIAESTEVGVFVQGSSAVLEGVLVTGTRARPDGELGVGVDTELAAVLGLRGFTQLIDSRVQGSVTTAVTAYGADLVVQHSHVTGVAPSESFGEFGDGISITNFPDVPTAQVVDSLVEGVARAGFTSFGGASSMGGTQIECAEIDLAGEVWGAVEPTFEDAGNNRCGCLGEERPCKVLSVSLTPPEPPPQL